MLTILLTLVDNETGQMWKMTAIFKMATNIVQIAITSSVIHLASQMIHEKWGCH